MKKLFPIALIAASVSFASNAEVRINGFANMIGGMTLSSDDTMYGYNDDISFDQNSLFAIQVSGDINDKTTATAQIISRGSDDYSADFEWAYLTYQATDHMSVSAGRFRSPLFKYSATLDVGYSYHWVQAPESVYDVTFNNVDGFRIDYSDYAGDWEYRGQLVIGSNDSTIDIEGVDAQQDISNIIAASIEVQRDWFTARALVGRGKLTVDVDGLEDLLYAISAYGYGDLAEGIRLNEDTGVFAELGIDVDHYDWFISGEYTYQDVEKSFSPEAKAFYVTAGLRVGQFTPHLTFENRKQEAKYLNDALALPTATVDYNGTSYPLNLLTYSVLNLRESDIDTYTAGVRYDFAPNLALKLDVSRQNDKLDNSNDATLLRFAVNYVF